MDPMGLNEKGYFPLEQIMMLFLDVFEQMLAEQNHKLLFFHTAS